MLNDELLQFDSVSTGEIFNNLATFKQDESWHARYILISSNIFAFINIDLFEKNRFVSNLIQYGKLLKHFERDISIIIIQINYVFIYYY